MQVVLNVKCDDSKRKAPVCRKTIEERQIASGRCTLDRRVKRMSRRWRRRSTSIHSMTGRHRRSVIGVRGLFLLGSKKGQLAGYSDEPAEITSH